MYILSIGDLGNMTWIALVNGSTTYQWDDMTIPSCPPPFNKTQFESEVGFAIPNNNFNAIGPGWSIWNPGNHLQLASFICEYGKIWYKFRYKL